MNIAMLGLDNSLIMYAETESESRRGRGKVVFVLFRLTPKCVSLFPANAFKEKCP